MGMRRLGWLADAKFQFHLAPLPTAVSRSISPFINLAPGSAQNALTEGV
jgi:hypothetical protein